MAIAGIPDDKRAARAIYWRFDAVRNKTSPDLVAMAEFSQRSIPLHRFRSVPLARSARPIGPTIGGGNDSQPASFMKSRPIIRIVFAVAWFAGGLGISARPGRAERWTSLSGSRTVEADFIGLWGNSVVLELPGPRRVAVDINDLIAESRIQARRLGEQQQQQRREVIEGIRADAKAAAAPAPNPLPTPPEAAEYQRPNSGGSALDHLEWLHAQVRNGHVLAFYDAMPASYQDDLQRVVRQLAGKLDQTTTRQLLGSIHSIGDLVVTRQRWLFSHPRLEKLPPESRDNLERTLLAVSDLIRHGLDPDELQLDQLSDMPFREWLAGLDRRIAPHLAELNDLLETPTGGATSSSN